MKKGFTKEKEYQILEDLIKSTTGLYVYLIPTTYKVDPNEIFKFIEKYKNWIYYKNGKLLTYDYAIGAIKSAIGFNQNKGVKILDKFLGDKIPIDSLYIPLKLKSINRKRIKD